MRSRKSNISREEKTNKADKTATIELIKSKLSIVSSHVRRNKRWTEEENDLLRKISEMREKADRLGEEQPDQDTMYEGLAKILGRTKPGVIRHWQAEKLYVSKKNNKNDK